eukprot:750355-Prymnesium_polylepis.1
MRSDSFSGAAHPLWRAHSRSSGSRFSERHERNSKLKRILRSASMRPESAPSTSVFPFTHETEPTLKAIWLSGPPATAVHGMQNPGQSAATAKSQRFKSQRRY